MHPRTTVVALLLVLAGCPKAVPARPPPPPPPAPTAAQQLEAEVSALAAEALALVKEQDELLWAHWTAGAPLELEQPARQHSALFEDAALAKVRLARSTGVGDPTATKRLERWLVGERLARATAEANAALTQLEAATTFGFEGKPLQWRELSRVLANEKSAVKRAAIWAASRAAVPALAEGHRLRDEAVAKALAALGTTAAGYAGVTPEQAAALARQLLDGTQAEWEAALAQLAKAELGLPAAKLNRAALPRLLRPSTSADASFPKAEQAAKAATLLGALGLYGLAGLTLDLAESPKKNPLPLTVAPGGAADVRVSVRPGPGARELGALLGELGRALALHRAGEPPTTLPRLADPLLAEISSRLFAELGATPAWLESIGVSPAAAASVATSFRALRLYTLRRAAGVLLAQQEAAGLSDEAAAPIWGAWLGRALWVGPAPEDAARWRLETDPLLGGVLLLEAARGADGLRQSLSAQWWADPASAAILEKAWRAAPAKSSPDPAAGE